MSHDKSPGNRSTPDSEPSDPRHPSSDQPTNGPTETPRDDRGSGPDEAALVDRNNQAKDRDPAEGGRDEGERANIGTGTPVSTRTRGAAGGSRRGLPRR